MAQHAVRITIPDDLDYADLKLSRDVVTGGVDFDWAPIERICEASGLDIALNAEMKRLWNAQTPNAEVTGVPGFSGTSG